MTAEAIIGDTEIFTPSNRISWVIRNPAIVQPELVRPERGLDVTGCSGPNLAERRKKMSGP